MKGYVFVSLYCILPHFALKTFDDGENNGYNFTSEENRSMLFFYVYLSVGYFFFML